MGIKAVIMCIWEAEVEFTGFRCSGFSNGGLGFNAFGLRCLGLRPPGFGAPRRRGFAAYRKGPPSYITYKTILTSPRTTVYEAYNHVYPKLYPN